MPLEAGKLRHRVSLQSQLQTQNPVTGDIAITWVEVAEIWASVEPLSAREFIAAQAVQSNVTTRITIRKREVDATMRIVYGSTVYNIHGVLSDPMSGNEYLTLPCSQGVNDGR